MPWLVRGEHKYYYRSQRQPDGRVKKVYFGRGQRAEKAAQMDAEARYRREAERAEARHIAANLESLDTFAKEMAEVVDLLAVATFTAGGLHLHKGQWRKRRNGNGSQGKHEKATD
jgi:hypothetical protein